MRIVYSLYDSFSQNVGLANLDCEECQVLSKHCPSQLYEHAHIPPEDVPKHMYKPKGMYEVVRWTQFNSEFITDIINDEPKLMMNSFWNEEIQAICQVALQYINAKTNQTWSLSKIVNGYVKNDVLQGTNYIIDLELTPTLMPPNDMCHDKSTFRVEMVHYLTPIKSSRAMVVQHENNVDLKVFLFVTLSSTKVQKLISSFPTLAVQTVEIYIVVVTANKERDFEQIKQLQDLVTNAAKTKDTLKVIVLVKDTGFHRTVLLNNVLSKSTKSRDIIMLLTEDVVIKQSLINHCKVILKPMQRVYFPVAFGQFNPELVVKGMPPGKSKNIDVFDHNKFTGQWQPYNYDFVCAYSQDLKPALSHLSTVHDTFAEKDFGIHLNEQFMRQGIEVVRSVSPGLYKDFSNARCNHDAAFNKENELFCLREKVEGMASKPALGILYLTEIEKKNLKDKS